LNLNLKFGAKFKKDLRKKKEKYQAAAVQFDGKNEMRRIGFHLLLLLLYYYNILSSQNTTIPWFPIYTFYPNI